MPGAEADHGERESITASSITLRDDTPIELRITPYRHTFVGDDGVTHHAYGWRAQHTSNDLIVLGSTENYESEAARDHNVESMITAIQRGAFEIVEQIDE